ncbi:MAG: mechanosensitive ion channel family protein [Candidatus Methylomirabilales bacterium]
MRPDTDRPGRRGPGGGAARAARRLALLGCLALWLPAAAAAQPAAAPEATSPIPAEDVATRAAEVTALLEAVDALSAPSPESQAIERQLPERSRRLQAGGEATLRRLAAGPSGPQLEDMASAWTGVRADLQAWADQLATQARRLQQEVERLADLREAWTRSLQEIQAARGPGPVVQEIQGILNAIATAQARLAARRASLLILQYQVGLEIRRVDRILGRIAQAKTDLGRHLATRTAPPVWSTALWRAARDQLGEGLRAGVVRWQSGLTRAAASQGHNILLQALLFAVVLILLLRARRGGQEWLEAQPGARGAARMLERPAAAAFVLALLATPWLYPGYSLSIVRTAKLLGIAPALRLLTPLLPMLQARTIQAFGLVLAAEAFRPFLLTAPELDHLLFLAEMLAAGVLFGLLVRAARRRAPGPAGRLPGLFGIAVALWLAFLLSLAAAALGYLQLAWLVGDAALQSTYAAMAILIAIWVLQVLAAYALWSRPLALLGSVRHARSRLLQRASPVLRGLGVVAWALVSLRPLTLFAEPAAVLRGVLNAGIRWGAFRLTLGDLLIFSATVWAALLLAEAVRAVLHTDVFPRVRLAHGIPLALANLSRYTIVLLGFMLGLSALGVDLTKVTILIGAIGVGIGFGLQTLVGNFAAGLILLFERPIREGDAIQVGDIQGQVHHIGVRASTVRTTRGAEVFVPNQQLLTSSITNWTYGDRTSRIDLPVTVAVASEPRRVADLLCRVAAEHPDVLKEPPPAAVCLGLGAGGLAFELRIWTNHFERADTIRSELAEAAHAALVEAQIAFR